VHDVGYRAHRFLRDAFERGALVDNTFSRLPRISFRHSTVTDFARFLSWSTSVPLSTPVW
jgi:hypothetical protein